MSNKNNLRFFVVLLFAAFASAALVLVDAGALAQNANSSTTEASAQNDNTNANMSAPRRGRRGRRGSRRAAAADANANTTMEPGTTPETSGATGGGQRTAAASDDDSRGDLSGEQVDLSGTYEGNLSTTGGVEVGRGKSTLTITGNTFTLTDEGGATHNGRIYAVLTRGEASAALYFADMTDPATNTVAVYNVRARKRGDSLKLWPAPQTKARLTFASGGGGGGRRGRR
ncbi:MAG: polymer-forming cytoskeletal protein [Pyrinomonadaceae bacterium]